MRISESGSRTWILINLRVTPIQAIGERLCYRKRHGVRSSLDCSSHFSPLKGVRNDSVVSSLLEKRVVGREESSREENHSLRSRRFGCPTPSQCYWSSSHPLSLPVLACHWHRRTQTYCHHNPRMALFLLPQSKAQGDTFLDRAPGKILTNVYSSLISPSLLHLVIMRWSRFGLWQGLYFKRGHLMKEERKDFGEDLLTVWKLSLTCNFSVPQDFSH